MKFKSMELDGGTQVNHFLKDALELFDVLGTIFMNNFKVICYKILGHQNSCFGSHRFLDWSPICGHQKSFLAPKFMKRVPIFNEKKIIFKGC